MSLFYKSIFSNIYFLVKVMCILDFKCLLLKDSEFISISVFVTGFLNVALPGCHGTSCVDQTGLELTDPPARVKSVCHHCPPA